MILLAEIIFCLSALAILHTYVFYPLLLMMIGGRNKGHKVQEATRSAVTIICAAYNEEKVIEQKIFSTFNTSFPGKVTLLIGTDNCSDRTVEIIKKLQGQYPQLKLKEFTQRTGKIGILNILCHEVENDILVMTDANVFFTPDTIGKLVENFADKETVLVCGRVVKRPASGGVVTQSELRYMNFENRLKAAESHAFGVVIGAEGGCYAFRKEIFQEIPSHFIADDFFITCLALRTGKKVLFEENALGYEDLAADTAGEFRRKARIATGNFQNLFYFKDLLAKFWAPTAFCFFSHKVLRWLTPFFFVLNVFAACCLLEISVLRDEYSRPDLFYLSVLGAEALAVLLPFLNYLFTLLAIRIKPLMAFSHFMLMNLALLVGFFRFCKGVKSSVWEPVKR